MTKVGFDVSNFLAPYTGDPLGGQKMLLRVHGDAAEARRQIFQNAQQVQLEKQRQARQAAALEAQLAERAVTRQALQEARVGAEQRANARLELDRSKEAFDQQKGIGEQNAAAIQALMTPFVAGDANALAAARARVQAQDPALRVTIPSDPAPSTSVAPLGETFSADQVFDDSPGGRMVVSRGDRELYRGDQSAVRANELAVLGRTLDPLMASPYAGAYAPAVEAGKQLAGSGMAGKDAAELALKQANTEANRGVQEQMAGARLGETVAKHDADKQFKLHDRIQGIGRQYMPQKTAIDKDTALIGEIRMQLASGVPMAENQALKGLLMRYTGKAMSNVEAQQAESSAGQWTRLEKLLRQWTAGGSLPPDFKEQMESGLESIDRYNRLRLHKLGVGGRDAMYSATQLPMDIDERVNAGAEVYTNLTGKPMTPEQLAAEKVRLLRLQGGTTAPALPAQGRPDMGGSGAQGNLGVAPVPGAQGRARSTMTLGPVTVSGGRTSPSREDQEADEALKLLEQLNAEP
jgi:hypothetical protein